MRAALGFTITGDQVVFSPGGEHLIVDGNIHRTSDWSQIGLLEGVGNRRILFAPDRAR